MAVPVAALAKIAAAALSDEDTRRKLGWIVAAICSPLILTLALICSLLSGSAEHNNSAVLLCFNGGNIPGKTPAEYVAYIEDMRRSFTLLDDAIAAVNDMTENSDSLDGIRVKAVFYAIFFGEDTPSRRAHKQFVDCFVTYEERTRTVTDEDGTETEESYTVAIPVADIAAVYGNLENVLHLEISAEQKSNADSIYNLVRYGVAGGSEGWIPGADVPYIGADGFCSPIGSGWERRVTSEFGNRVDPITGKRKGARRHGLGRPHRHAHPRRAAGDGNSLQVQRRRLWLLCHDRPRQWPCHAVRPLLSAAGKSGTDGGGGRHHRPLRQHRALHRAAPPLRDARQWGADESQNISAERLKGRNDYEHGSL